MSALREVQDTGLDWLGSIPAHWQLKRLGSVFRERKQTVNDTDFPPLSVTMQGVVPQMDNVAKTMNNDARKLVLAGDYVINSRSDRKGSGGLADRDGSVSVISTVLEPQGIHPRFAHHLLRSTAFQEEFYRWGSGIVADLWSTRYLAMSRIEVPLPPQEEQAAIADFLDRETTKIDAVIEKQRALVDGLRGRQRAMIEHALSSGDWPKVPVKHLVSVNAHALSETTDPSMEFRYVDISGASQGSFRPSDEVLTFGSAPSRARRLAEPGDVIVSTVRTYLRAVSLVPETDETLVFSTGFAVLHPNSDEVDSQFLAYCLQSDSFIGEVVANSEGVSYPAISAEKLTNLCIPVPPPAKQQELAARMDRETARTDALIARLDRLTELSQERRSALITAAVTGQIDITTDTKALEGAA